MKSSTEIKEIVDYYLYTQGTDIFETFPILEK